MIKHSRYKKTRYKKTRKKIKGGSIPTIFKIDEKQVNSILAKIFCAINPLCILETIAKEFVFSIKMLNDILLLSGLYVKNLFYLGYESNLNNILPKSICFDLFEENTCNTKISKLLNIQSLKEDNTRLPKELMYVKQMKGGKTRKQRGGSFRGTCKNNQTPGVICADDRSNINEFKPKEEKIKNPIVKALNEYVKFPKLDIFPDKETANVSLLNNLKVFSIFDLYNILKIIRVLYYIDDGAPIPETPKEPEKYKLHKDDILRIEHNFKKSKGFKEWEKCNDFHLERDIDEETRELLTEQCNVKCPDCTMKKQSLLYSSDEDVSVSFNNNYDVIQKIIQTYYICDKSKTYDHTKIYDLLNDENKRIQFMNNLTEEQLFDFFNIGTPRNKQIIQEDILIELKQVARLNKSLSLHSIIPKLLLYKLFNDSTPKDKIEFQKLNFNSSGVPLSNLIPNSR